MIAKYGDSWTRPASAYLSRSLLENCTTFRQKLDVAGNSDVTIRQKIDTQIHLIEHLCMSRDELEASIPASVQNSTLALKDSNVRQLKTHLNTLNENLKQRSDIVKSLRKTKESDNFGAAMMKHAATSAELEEAAIFEAELKPYMDHARSILILVSEQKALLEAINVKLTDSGRA